MDACHEIEEFVEDCRSEVIQRYGRGMLTYEQILECFKFAVNTRLSIISSQRRSSPEIMLLKQASHLPVHLKAPSWIEQIFEPLYEEGGAYAALLDITEPGNLNENNVEMETEYTVVSREANRVYKREIHKCTFWLYNFTDTTEEQFGREFIDVEMSALPENLPFKKIVTVRQTGIFTNMAHAFFHANGLKVLGAFDEHPQYPRRLYHGVGKIEGYRPFECLYIRPDRNCSNGRLCCILRAEENHPRWKAYREFKRKDRLQYNCQVAEWYKWCIHREVEKARQKATEHLTDQ